MSRTIESLITALKAAAQEEIMFRESSDTSDQWQDEATPENVLRLVEALSAKQAEPDFYVLRLKNDDEYGPAELLIYETSLNASKAKADFGGEIILGYTTPPANSPVVPEGWIKCIDYKPERDTDVQVYCSDTNEQLVAFHLGNGEFQYAQHEDTSITCRPSHWMPLPAAPEKPL